MHIRYFDMNKPVVKIINKSAIEGTSLTIRKLSSFSINHQLKKAGLLMHIFTEPIITKMSEYYLVTDKSNSYILSSIINYLH